MKISVIVPVFNSAPYLRECIESILASKNVDIELILIDDGSTDGSGKICDEYKATVIHRENRGVAASRNDGISLASGEYTAFVDSDDVVEPDYFSNMLEYLVKNNCDVVISGLHHFSDDINESTFFETINIEQGVYSESKIADRIINSMISGGLKNPFKKPATGSACICLYKTSLIKDLKFPPTKISEDLIFQINALSQAKTVGKIDEFKYCYRVIKGRETRSSKYAPELWEQQLELISYMDCFDNDAVHARIIYQALRCCGNECVKENQKTWNLKIKRIKDILGNECVKSVLDSTKKIDYSLKTRLILMLMKTRAAAIIFLYLSSKKHKGG